MTSSSMVSYAFDHGYRLPSILARAQRFTPQHDYLPGVSLPPMFVQRCPILRAESSPSHFQSRLAFVILHI